MFAFTIKTRAMFKLLSTSVLLICCLSVYGETIKIKPDAPTEYVVKKGDTLWDISSIFLDQAWLWPELWRNNTQIENPHLIYPGDLLRLRYENGVPVIEIVREKHSKVLTPYQTTTQKPEPISLLPWGTIASLLNGNSIMLEEDYERLPYVLGDHSGSPRFASRDFILTRMLDSDTEYYQVIRKGKFVKDSRGKFLGMLTKHIADAELANILSNERFVMKINDSFFEAKQGDKLITKPESLNEDIQLLPAPQGLEGELVRNINDNILSSQSDVVVINLGKDSVKPGTIFGIYQRGPDIFTGKSPKYTATHPSPLDLVRFKKRIEQPAMKVGELVVIKSYDNASYAWILSADETLRGGEILSAP